MKFTPFVLSAIGLLLWLPGRASADSVTVGSTLAQYSMLGQEVSASGGTINGGDIGSTVSTSSSAGGSHTLDNTDASTALTQLTSAYNTITGFTDDTSINTQALGTVSPGTYKLSQSYITGVTLNGAGTYFFVDSSLSIANSFTVALTNGATSSNVNVFWVGSSISIGSSALVIGDVLSSGSLSVSSGTIVDGSIWSNGSTSESSATINYPTQSLSHNTVPLPASVYPGFVLLGLLALASIFRGNARRLQPAK
jgi:hypothetical protein